MNYYPTNFYSNYPYQNTYGQQQMQNQAQMPQYTQPQLPQSTLQGKVVDSIDVARVSDVPLGGYAVFPKADLSEIYVKAWNNNGTTSMVTFKPFVDSQIVKEIDGKVSNDNSDINEMLLEKIDSLEEKINKIINDKEEKKVVIKQKDRKELSSSEY